MMSRSVLLTHRKPAEQGTFVIVGPAFFKLLSNELFKDIITYARISGNEVPQPRRTANQG